MYVFVFVGRFLCVCVCVCASASYIYLVEKCRLTKSIGNYLIDIIHVFVFRILYPFQTLCTGKLEHIVLYIFIFASSFLLRFFSVSIDLSIYFEVYFFYSQASIYPFNIYANHWNSPFFISNVYNARVFLLLCKENFHVIYGILIYFYVIPCWIFQNRSEESSLECIL